MRFKVLATKGRTPGESHWISPAAMGSPPKSKNTASTSTITVFTVRPKVAPKRPNSLWLSWLANWLVRLSSSLLMSPKSVGKPRDTAQSCKRPNSDSPSASQLGKALISSPSCSTRRGTNQTPAREIRPRLAPRTKP